jgi:VanZ family protein
VISRWLPVALYMGAIYYGAGMSQTPGPAAQVSDTVLHVGGYAGLALLTLRATSGGRWSGVTPRALLLAFVIATVHGATVEIEQMFVPTRFAEWRDLWNDAIGAALGLAAAWGWANSRWGKMKG